MRFNFSKVSAIGASVLLAGLTLGSAAAAAYPAPFIQGGVANVAVVYGTGAGVSSLDLVEAANIQSNLQSKMGSAVGSGSSVTGSAKSLASGSDLLYLLDDLAENVGTITKDDLPVVLADGDFVDNDGTSYEFEQTIVVGTSASNRFSFGNSDSDFNDPALMLELATSTSTPMYTWTISFDKATPLNATASEGEEFTLFGKTYTVGTATDVDTLILLGGADSTKISVGETASMTVDDVVYSVTLDGLSSATESVASITINGEAKTFTEGQTKTYVIDGVDIDVYAKTVFRTGDDLGHIQVELGSDKLTFESGDAVSVGADNTDIDGTLVTLTPTAGINALTKIEVAVAAEDSDANHVFAGESFTDPVFGTIRLELSSVGHGPVFDGESDAGTLRSTIELKKGGSRELEVEMTDSAGVTKTAPFSFQGILQDDARNPFITVEGNNLTDDDYFFLNSGDYQHLMKVSKVNLVDNAANSDLEIEDQFTGTKYLIENKDFTGGQNVTINSQTYTFTNNTAGIAAGGFRITRAGANAVDKRALFPYMELIAGDDFPRVTFINQTNLINDTTGDVIPTAADNISVGGKTYELPTGSVKFYYTDFDAAALGKAGAGEGGYITTVVTPSGGDATTTNLSMTTLGNADGVNITSIAVGKAWYTFGLNVTKGATTGMLHINNVTLDLGFNAWAVGTNPVSPMIMYVEDKDKADSENRHVVLLNTTDATYSELNGNPLFSGTAATRYDTETWETTEYVGYLTSYGTYILVDDTNTDHKLAKLTYGSDQMYADVFFAEEGAVISPGTTGGVGQLGDVLVKDSDVATVSTKNLIVVGGSCINSAAATLVGAAHCGADWTTATDIGTGEFLIKAYASSTITSKHALLVAGYAVADTVNAATYLRTKAVDTSKEYKGTSSTSAVLVAAEA